MKDLIINGSAQYKILNTSENNSPTSHKNCMNKKDVSSFSSYLQMLCEVVKHEEKIKAPGCSTNSEISPLEIKQSLLSAFNFLRKNSEPKVKSKPVHQHIMVGNCLTVYSNLDIAPIQKPFRKTSSEDLPVYIKSIINTDPSLSHLLKYGCISISPVKDAKDLTAKSNKFQNGDFPPNDHFKKGCAEKLLRLKKEASNFALKDCDAFEDTKLDVKKIFPEVFCGEALSQKTKTKSTPLGCSSYSNGEDFFSNSTEESQYEGNINPSDVLEICIQEEDSKSVLYGTNKPGCECSICHKCFATPIEMYFHILSHSKSSESSHNNFPSEGYAGRLVGLPDIDITTTKRTSYKGRNKKLKSILKDINYNQDVLTEDDQEMEVEPSIVNFHSVPEYALLGNNKLKKPNSRRSKKLLKYCDVQNTAEIRHKLVLKSSYRVQLNRDIKGRVNKAVHILCRRNSLNNKNN